MSLTEDTILARRYRIDALLARGRLGAVYRAFDTGRSTPVAVKEYFFPGPEQIAQFKQEAIILERLHHPGLASVRHHFSEAGKHYLVMDYIEGEELGQLIEQKQQPLAAGQAVTFIIQICQAVGYLHRQNPPLVHRDIKPKNIKITPAGQAVLVDFGLPRQVTGASRPTQAGEGFWPPEQYKEQRLTPASDIYSLGATLYAALTGIAPPDSAALPGSRRGLKPPHQINSKINRPLSEAVLGAMNPDPANRPPSVAVWQKELASIAETLSPTVSEETPRAASAPAALKNNVDKAQPEPSASPGSDPTFWLVDATGLGYPIGPESLVIGAEPQADIVVEEAASSDRVQIRVAGRRCQVRPGGDMDGVLLNGERLGAAWNFLNPGDLLTIGAARFHITTSRPVKLASAQPKPAAPLAQKPPPASAQAAEPPEPISKPGRRRAFSAALLVTLVGLIAIAIFQWPFISTRLPFLAALPFPQATAPAEPLEPAGAGREQEAAQTTAGAEAARRVQQATATGQARLDAAATATAQAAAATATPILALSSDGLPTATPRPPTATPRPTPTPRPPTVTPTRTPLRVVPAASGPTVIPLKSEETLDRIGVREVIDVDINPYNPREVYAVIKQDGIYKSSNGGDSPWVKLPFDASGVVAFVIDPTNPARFYAPTWNAVLKSTDGGNTWQAKTTGLLSNRSVDVLAVDPRNPGRLYAGVGEELVVSVDGGESWSSLGYGEGLRLGRLHQIVIDPFDSDVVYVAGLGSAIYKSTDAGQSFVPAPINVGQGAYSLAAHPTRPDVYLAGINSSQAAIIKTENSWDFRSVSGGLVYGGADSAYAAITYAPGNPNIVYAGSGYEDNRYAKGIFKSVDGGERWTNVSHGLSLNPDFGLPYYVKSIAVHPTDPNLVFAATGGGLFKSVDGGAGWSLR